MKGSIGMDELFYGGAAVIFILVIAVLILQFSGGLEQFGDLFFQFFGLNQATAASYNEKVAEFSTVTLACVINSVASGKELECLKTPSAIARAQILPLDKREENQIQTGNILDIDKPKAMCKKAGVCCSFLREKTRGVSILDHLWTENQDECERLVGGIVITQDADILCRNSYLDCKLENFKLPQKVSAASEWIPYWGDPEFLVYWNNFPPEEDFWTYQSDWRIYLLVAAISVIPPVKAGKMVLGSSFKGIFSLIKKAFPKLIVEATAERIVTKTVTPSLVKSAAEKSISYYQKKGTLSAVEARAFREIVDDPRYLQEALTQAKTGLDLAKPLADSPEVAKAYAEKSVQYLLSVEPKTPITDAAKKKLLNKVEKEASRLAVKYAGSESLKEQMIAMFKARVAGKQVPRTIARGAAIGTTAWAAGVFDDWISARFEPVPNSIALKKYDNKPKGTSITGEWERNPVLVEVRNRKEPIGIFFLPQLIDIKTHFYLASPCHLKDMTIKQAVATCYSYSFDTSQSLTTCGGNIGDNEDVPFCVPAEYRVADNYGPLEFFENMKDLPAWYRFTYDDIDDTYIIPVYERVVFYYNHNDKEKSHFVKVGEEGIIGLKKDTVPGVYGASTTVYYPEKPLEVREVSMNFITSPVYGGGRSNYAKVSFGFDKFKSSSITGYDFEWTPQQIRDIKILSFEYIDQDSFEYFKAEGPEGAGILRVHFGTNFENELVGFSRSQYLRGSFSAIEIEGTGTINDDELLNKDLAEYGLLEKIQAIPGRNEILNLEKEIKGTWRGWNLGGNIYFNPEDTPGDEVIEMDLFNSNENPGLIGRHPGDKGSIILSDDFDDGELKTIIFRDQYGNPTVENAKKEKILNDKDPDSAGFEYYSLKNCKMPAILVIPGEKDSATDPNFCTGGLSTGEAWAESAGDIGLAAGIIGGLFLGGWPGFLVASGSGLFEVGTEYFAESMGQWPESW